ncbi:hypothetical protein VPHF86_0190 [Vibrio phage F86]
MNIKLLIRNEVRNNASRYVTTYDIMDDMLAKFPQARKSEDNNDGTKANSTLRREIARELDDSCNWTFECFNRQGRKLYRRVESNDLKDFVCK